MAGIFTISLDFELHWGVFDKRDRSARMTCYENTRNLIPGLLQAFEKNKVHVTWATVGSLFANDKTEWDQFSPSVKPTYVNKKVSAYEYVEQETIDEHETAFFAADLVKEILNYEGQELATHTFSHYYCCEDGQNVRQFDADLKAAKAAAEKLDVQITSLVFPRNQFNESYLEVCWNNGIKVVRSNPDVWYWTGIADNDTSIVRKLFRTGDTFVPLGKRTYPLSAIKKKKNSPLMLPASRLLRSYTPKYKVGNTLRLKRILSEMQYAAQHNECYHLWWHPENFGDHPSENMYDLQIILDHYKHLSSKYRMQSWNMAAYWKQLHP
jgi:peptidoglycan/xylan/chitin deacetylase (PgdA/CDA1 family)